MIYPTSFTLLTLFLFFGCIKTYRVKGKVLVEGMGIRSAEFYWFMIQLLAFIIFLVFEDIGQWALLIFYLLWLILLYLNHWRYFLFGASKKKIKGYNNCFQQTVRIFPASNKKIIPDLYHIILSILVVINIVALLLFIF